ncbi:MAG: DoxX family protein [Candidatus Eiseniibacteriota bacterium]|jgi:putative oxidoreductase
MTIRVLIDGWRRSAARWQQLAIRLPLGTIFIAHGGQALFGWWGGAGFVASLQSYQTHLGIPVQLAAVALLLQFFGGILIVVGLLTRVVAALLAILMVVAIIKVHLGSGFFLNWQLVAGRGHGVELNIALLGMCLALLLGGAGEPSIDGPDAPHP